MDLQSKIWEVISGSFPSLNVHPTWLAFVTKLVALFDSKYGFTYVLPLKDDVDAAATFATLMSSDMGNELVSTCAYGPLYRHHGIFATSPAVRCCVVSSNDTALSAYARERLVPFLRHVLGVHNATPLNYALSQPVELTYEAYATKRSFLGFGAPKDDEQKFLRSFVAAIDSKMGVMHAHTWYNCVNSNRDQHDLALHEAFLMLRKLKPQITAAGSAQVTLTAEQIALEGKVENLLRYTTLLAYYHAFFSIGAGARCRVAAQYDRGGTPFKSDLIQVHLQHYDDVMDFIALQPRLVRLTCKEVGKDAGKSETYSWQAGGLRASSMNASILTHQYVQACLLRDPNCTLHGAVHYGSLDYLMGTAFAILTPRETRSSSFSLPMQYLSMVGAIMAGTDPTRSVSFVSATPTRLREAFAGQWPVRLLGVRDAKGKVHIADGDDAKDLAAVKAPFTVDEAHGIADVVLRQLLNPLHTSANASHIVLPARYGVKYVTHDNLTSVQGNVREWTMNHVAYLNVYGDLLPAAAPLAGDLGGYDFVQTLDEDGDAVAHSVDAMKHNGIDLKEVMRIASEVIPTKEGTPYPLTAIAAFLRDGKLWEDDLPDGYKGPEVQHLCKSWLPIGDYRWLCNGASNASAFAGELFFHLNLGFDAPVEFVVRVKGLGSLGYVVNLFAFVPIFGTIIAPMKEVKHEY